MKKSVVISSRNPEMIADDVNTWTAERLLTLTGLTVAQFFSYTSVYILSSFYPPLAEEKQLSGIELGLVIGIIQGVFTIAAYSFVQLIHVFSAKYQIIFGLVLTGFCTIGFGFLDSLPDGKIFFAVCFVVRILQGIGIAATDLCVLILANEVTPPRLLGTVIGILECAVAAAIALSPAIGGYLYQVGGFYLSFLVSGIASILSAGFCCFALPKKDASAPQGLKKILQNTSSFDMIVFITHFTLGGGFSGFFAGIIEPHLRQFDLTTGEVGLVVLITNAISGLTFPVWGYVCDKLVKPAYVTLIGCLLTSVGFILFGPFPYLPLESSLYLVAGSLVLSGCGISAILISAYTDAKSYLKATCDSEDLANTVISASYPSTYNIGAFLGAILGGIFVEYIGYREGAAILLGLQMFGILLQAFMMIRKKLTNKESLC